MCFPAYSGAPVTAPANRLAAESAVGEPMLVKLVLRPQWGAVVDAIGGGPLIVRDGQPVFAALEDLKGRFHEISRDGLKTAIDISAYSLVALSRAALPLFDKAGGGSVMSLTYNAVDRVVPSYNSMAMAKAVLEAETRYLAADLGPHNVRVNAISAGPLKTLAGSAVKGVSQARDLMVEKAPLRRNITQDEVGNVAVFLASEWSRAVTGDTIFADNGFNILGVTE